MLLASAAMPIGAWMLIAAIVGGAVLAMLHTLACVARNERAVHDVRKRVVELRNHYAEQLAELEQRNLAAAGGQESPAESGTVDDPMVVGAASDGPTQPASPAEAA